MVRRDKTQTGLPLRTDKTVTWASVLKQAFNDVHWWRVPEVESIVISDSDNSDTEDEQEKEVKCQCSPCKKEKRAAAVGKASISVPAVTTTTTTSSAGTTDTLKTTIAKKTDQ